MTNTGRPVVEEISRAFSTDVCFVCAGRIPEGNIKNANTQAVNFMTELTAGLQGVNRREPDCKDGAATMMVRLQPGRRSKYAEIPREPKSQPTLDSSHSDDVVHLV
jgi:hypothetical protein